MINKEYHDFELKYDQDIDAKREAALAVLDAKFPLEDRVLRMEQIKADKELNARAAEIVDFTGDEIPTLAERLSGIEQMEVKKINTGFTKLDAIVNGFREGNTYLVAGLEKSGKSSLLMNIGVHMLKANEKVGYINTELSDKEFADRMAAIHFSEPMPVIEAQPSLTKKWLADTENQFFYAGYENPKDLKKDNLLSFEKTMERMESFVREGVKVIMIDNLTTYSTLASGDRKGWEILGSCVTKIVSFAKQKQVVCFMVIHTKPGIVISETPSGLKSIIQNDPKGIFAENAAAVRRPTLTDVYGGGSALSQVSGALIVWRPYQKFDQDFMQRMSAVCLDSFRHAPSGKIVTMLFDGERSTFTEAVLKSEEERILQSFEN